jgi:rhodanese-related sulfurtransferase
MREQGDISPSELKGRLERGDHPFILDVREPWEVALARLDGAINVPMGDVPARLCELDPDGEIVVFCHHGIRSAQVAAYLAHQGFDRVRNLTGGIDAFSAIDPAVPRY